MIRTNPGKRFGAIVLLTIFTFQIVAPTASYALTSGPHQQEFTSYEDPGTTDMVNLLTGDFTYNLPLLDIPGPESTFSIPLTYHSGAGLEQESSWVGLGFTLNPGAIVRNVVEYPDDASGEDFHIHKEDPDVVRGWSSALLGLGNIGWNTATGHYGTISLLNILSVGYRNGSMNDVGIVGVHFSGGNVSAEPVEVASAVMTIASFGAGAAAAKAGEVAKSIAIDAAVSVATSAAMSLAFSGTPSFTSGGYWALKKDTDQRLFHKNYWYWLDASRYEDMYGILHLSDMPTVDGQVGGTTMPTVINSEGMEVSAPVYVDPKNYQDLSAGSDMHMDWDGSDYFGHFNPTSLSKDIYSVMGPGVSGTIEPYRLDVGSLAMPRKMTLQQFRVAYPKFEDYKVPFRYSGSQTNSYTHHAGMDELGNVDISEPQFGVQYSVATENINDNRKLTYELTDDVLKTRRVQDDRYGLDNKRLAQGKNIEWYTNGELKNPPVGFSDFLPATSRETFRSMIRMPASLICRDGNWEDGVDVGSENAEYFNVGDTVRIHGAWTFYSESGTPSLITFDEVAHVIGKNSSIITFDIERPGETNYFRIDVRKTPIPQSSIGGYSVTKEDGTTYNYALPVFSWNNYSWVANKSDETEKTEFTKLAPFASTWLLTSITGSDYIDRNANGLVDNGDWGAWVKFEYGRYSNTYSWRIPYSGNSVSADDETVSFSSGRKQQYFLNNISTRTHTALFVKDKRNDAKGIASQLQTSSSLKLAEIVLLKNEDYEKLITPSDQGGIGASMYSNTEAEETSIVGAGATGGSETESYKGVWDLFDINRTAEITAFLKAKSLKKVRFNYSYRLCSNTPNSYPAAFNPGETRTGKLTLESLSMYGPNDLKMMPDYIFDYGYNPAYNKDHWDGWGAYNPQAVVQNHQANPDPAYGGAWQLSEITTPIGSKMIIDYERDSYASVSGHDAETRIKALTFNTQTGKMTFDIASAGITDLRDFLQNGQTVILKSAAKQVCACWDISDAWTCSYDYIFPESQTISDLTADSFILSSWPGFVNEYNDGVNGRIGCGLENLNGTYIADTRGKNGGNSRVAALSVQDENNNVYKTRYIYTQDGISGGRTSGVVGQEPDFAQSQEYDFYKLYDYPFTPVLYSKTTVLRGKLSTDDDFHTRQEFRFATPHWNMVSVTTEENIPEDGIALYVGEDHIFQHDELVLEVLRGKSFALDVRTASIGQLQSIKTYDGKGNLKASTILDYTSEIPDMQGVFTEGTMLIEKIGYEDQRSYMHKVSRTNKTYFPSFLKSITTSTENYREVTVNKKYDFITGNVLETESQNSLGINYRSVTVPAYTIYNDMGPKSVNQSNKHMLSQTAASYQYKIDANGNSLGLIAAGVQLWSNDWDNYRTFNAASGQYENETSAIPVWRKHKSFIWQSPERNSDGTLKNFIDYNWTASTQDDRWIKASEITRYDHYSMALESKDVNEEHASIKMGYNSALSLLAGTYSRYTELAYSGAEDKIEVSPSIFHFGGEVMGGEKQDATYHHTGSYAIKLLGNEKGFTYKARVGTELETGRKYRASVWIHKTDVGTNSGELYAEANGIDLNVASISSSTTRQAGDWYLLSLDIDVLSEHHGQMLTVGCRNSGTGITYFDDFRFHPIETPVNTYVYDPRTFEVTYTLDNDNLYTRFEYDQTGKLTKTYREVLGTTHPERLISHSQYNYARMKSPVWKETGNVRCAVDAEGANTGEQEKELRDLNELSPSYNQLTWVSAGNNSSACPY